MHGRETEILWTTPAQDRFIEDFNPTREDIDEINGAVKAVRDDPPDDGESAPVPIDKDSIPELEEVEGKAFLCRAGKWFVYYTVLPKKLVVVLVDDGRARA